MNVTKRSPTVVRSIKRGFLAVALACLPALILILSAAPDGCSGGCPGLDLTPGTSVVEIVP